MSVDIPSKLQPLVNDELSSGDFTTESDLVAAALETYLEMRRRHGVLKGRVELSLKQIQQGLVSPLDVEEVKQKVRRFAEVNDQDAE